MTIQEQAVKHFGSAHQLAKYAEELCEAAAAIIRWQAGPTPENYQQMIEEVADVEICTAYPRLVLYVPDIDNAKQAKLERLAETIRGKG